jgi:hypothetical protein
MEGGKGNEYEKAAVIWQNVISILETIRMCFESC